jgi:hypothetical protein
MAIKGHKERALLRRGHHVQEALQRRIKLTENYSLRRNIVEAMGGSGSRSEDYYVKFSDLCQKDKTKSGSLAYCLISKLLDDLNASGNSELAEDVYHSLITINEFFKSIRGQGQEEPNPIKRRRDDKQLFKKTVLTIFKNENPANAFNLIANFIKDSAYDKDEVKRALLDYRSTEKSIKQSELEEFLKRARFKEYSKYENSFKGSNFDLLKGRSVLSHGYINHSTGKPETFFNIIKMLYDLLETQSYENYEVILNEFTRNIANGVLNTDIEDLIYKSDLQVLENLMVDDEVILEKGSYVEVKKFDLAIDSYFSEYFAMYKNVKKLPKIAKTTKFIDLYNKVIDGVFDIVKNEGQFMIKKISDNIDAVMYDKNRIALKDDIEFYWSNKGQRDCGDRRLSIRFRIKNPNITVYLYDSKTHSNQLTPLEISGLSIRPKTFC